MRLRALVQDHEDGCGECDDDARHDAKQKRHQERDDKQRRVGTAGAEEKLELRQVDQGCDGGDDDRSEGGLEMSSNERFRGERGSTFGR